MSRSYFLEVIRALRQNEEIVLYGNILKYDQSEADEVTTWLAAEYQKEVLDFPFTPPPFHPVAACWGAATVYVAAQLILYRENKAAEFRQLLPQAVAEPTPSSILSADLTLRFLPELITQLRVIDTDDPLAPCLEELLTKWHYSGIRYALNPAALDFSVVSADPCLKQMYANRVTLFKKMKLALQPALADTIKANLGMHAAGLWNEFNIETKINEQHR